MSSAVRNFLVTFLVAAIIFSAASYMIIKGVNNFLDDDIDSSETQHSDVTEKTVETDDNGEIISEKPVVDDSFTMLLIGTDYQPDKFTDYDVSEINSTKEGFPLVARPVQTDALVILKADRINKEFVMISIPSNMTVTVDGISVLLKNVYNQKGIDFLLREIRALTGIDCDYYAMVSVADFVDIIDSVGGIYYSVPTDMYYRDNLENLTIDIRSGSQTLDGETAVKMLRYCSYADGDVSRRTLATSFAKALLKKMATSDNLNVAANLYTDLVSHVTTNFTLTDLTRHLDIIFAYNEFTAKELSYPGTVKYDSNGIAYFEGDLDKAIKTFADYR